MLRTVKPTYCCAAPSLLLCLAKVTRSPAASPSSQPPGPPPPPPVLQLHGHALQCLAAAVAAQQLQCDGLVPTKHLAAGKHEQLRGQVRVREGHRIPASSAMPISNPSSNRKRLRFGLSARFSPPAPAVH